MTSRGVARTLTKTEMENFAAITAVNYCCKSLHLTCLHGPGYTFDKSILILKLIFFPDKHRKSPVGMLSRKKFAKFIGKHLRRSLLFNRVAGCSLETSLKRDSDTAVLL